MNFIAINHRENNTLLLGLLVALLTGLMVTALVIVHRQKMRGSVEQITTHVGQRLEPMQLQCDNTTGKQ